MQDKNNKLSDEKLLVRQAKQGDPLAIQKLLDQNEKLIYKLTSSKGVGKIPSSKNFNYTFLKDDLISEAQSAFVEAVEQFDLDKGAKLSTFAYRIISTTVRRCVKEWSTSISCSLEDRYEDFNDNATYTAPSPFYDSYKQQEAELSILKAGIESLTHIEQEAIKLSFWKGLKGKEIGKLLSVSPARISTALKSARKKLKVFLIEHRTNKA